MSPSNRWRGLVATFLFAGVLSPCVPASAAVPAAERQTLVNLYNSTNGANWVSNDNWLTGDPCDNGWYGIGCDDAGQHVREIDLPNNGLSGLVPNLSALASLRILSLHYNQLSGSIPSLSALGNLWVVSLRGNHLSGPIPSLMGLGNLAYLDLSNNQLSGPVPDAFANGMVQIQLNNNQLSGPIPSLLLVTLGNLERFRVEHNQLSGTPPRVPIPNNLLHGESGLCPNRLSTPSPTDAAWDAAVGHTWSDGCHPDQIFYGGFEWW